MGRTVERGSLMLQRREKLTQGQHPPSLRDVFFIADKQSNPSSIQLCKAYSITKVFYPKTSVSSEGN